MRLFVLWWAVYIALFCADPAAAPSRIASLNLCTDSMLFELVSTERIVSVTILSRDRNLSYFSDVAQDIPANHGHVEEIIRLRPDLVLAGRGAANSSVPLLKRLGLTVVTFQPAESLDQFRQNFLRLAEAVDETERAGRLLAALDRRMHGASNDAPPKPLTAVVYQANGYVAGPQTLIGDLINAAGLHNGAADLGLVHGGFVSLERLILARPDLLVFGREIGAYPSLAGHLLNHPALLNGGFFAGPGTGLRHVEMPTQLWTCGGTFLSIAVDRLVSAARRAP